MGAANPELQSVQPPATEPVAEINNQTARREKSAGFIIAKRVAAAGTLALALAACGNNEQENPEWPDAPVAEWSEWSSHATVPVCENGAEVNKNDDGDRKVRPLLSNDEANPNDHFSTVVEVSLPGSDPSIYSFAEDGAGATVSVPKDIYQKAQENKGSSISMYALNSPFEDLPESANASIVLETFVRAQGLETSSQVSYTQAEQNANKFFALCRHFLFIDGEPHDTVTPGNYYDYNERAENPTPEPDNEPAPNTGANVEAWLATDPQPLDCREPASLVQSTDSTTLLIQLEEGAATPHQTYAMGAKMEWQDENGNDEIYTSIRAIEVNPYNQVGAFLPTELFNEARQQNGIVTIWSAPIPSEVATAVNNERFNGSQNTVGLFKRQALHYDTLSQDQQESIDDLFTTCHVMHLDTNS